MKQTLLNNTVCIYTYYYTIGYIHIPITHGNFTFLRRNLSPWGAFLRLKQRLYAAMERFLFSAKWNYPKEKDILHTLLRRILSPWGAFLRLKQRLRFNDKSIVTRKVKLSKTAKNAILAEFRNRKSYLFPIKNRNDTRNAPWHDLRGVFPFFIAIIRSVRSSSELPLWYKYREDGFPSDLRLWYGQTLLFRAVRVYSRIRSSPYLSGYRRPAGRSYRKPFPCKEHGLQRPRERAS